MPARSQTTLLGSAILAAPPVFPIADIVTGGGSTSEPLLSQKFENEARNFVVLFVQGEMAGVKQMYLGVRQIALEGLASRER